MSAWLGAFFSRQDRVPVPDQSAWDEAFSLPVFAGFEKAESERLAELARFILTDKSISPIDAKPEPLDLAKVAALSALPILNLGRDWYSGWREIILYPDQFVPEREVTDEFGVVHRVRHPLSGEAWEGGPLVLSLGDVAESGYCEGYNVVIHEFAHKLDMRNGGANGLPPLHSGMCVEAWSAAFGSAYGHFRQRVDAGEETEIDPYASENPAEFFAVLSEYFFELPAVLHHDYPAVYQQMKLFYRQDPLARMELFEHDPATS